MYLYYFILWTYNLMFTPISKYLAFALNKVSINNHNHLKYLIIVHRITRFNEQSDVKLNDIEPN